MSLPEFSINRPVTAFMVSLILLLLGQRFIVKGLTAGAVKG